MDSHRYHCWKERGEEEKKREVNEWIGKGKGKKGRKKKGRKARKEKTER